MKSIRQNLLFVVFYLSFAMPVYGQEQTPEQYCGALGTWSYNVAWKRALGVPQSEVLGLIGIDESRAQGVQQPHLPIELPGIISFVYDLPEYEPTAANIAYIAVRFRELCIKEFEVKT